MSTYEELSNPARLIPWLKGLVSHGLGAGWAYVPYIEADACAAILGETLDLDWNLVASDPLVTQEGVIQYGVLHISTAEDDHTRFEVGSGDGSDARKAAMSDLLKRTSRRFGVGIWLTRLSKVQITGREVGNSVYPAEGEHERAMDIWAEQLIALSEDRTSVFPDIIWQDGGFESAASGGGQSGTSRGGGSGRASGKQANFLRSLFKRKVDASDVVYKSLVEAGAENEKALAVVDWLSAEEFDSASPPVTKSTASALIEVLQEVADAQTGGSLGGLDDDPGPDHY